MKQPRSFDDATHEIAAELAMMLVSKQHDYGPKNILNSPVGAERGVLVRLHDKLSRLANLIDRGEAPVHESEADTWLDIMGYGMIGLMLNRGWFELPLFRPDVMSTHQMFEDVKDEN